MRCLGMRRAVSLAALILCSASSAWAEAGDGPRVAAFRCDVTPPLGQPMFSCDPLRTVEQPLLAKGIVLESDGKRYVLCAVDWCELCNGSHLAWRKMIAEAAAAEVAHVAVQTVHQHTAPLVDIDAQKLLAEAGAAGVHLDPKALDEIERRVAAAVKEAAGRLEPFDQVGTGQAKVDRVASSRRPRDEAGNIRPRFSGAGDDPVMRALPEGTIDPYLKTITLARGEKPLVRLHYYATHPQSRYGDGRATSDVPGIAREKLERKEGVAQIYFTGCGGDITLGKYNDRSDKCREELAERLLAGMEAAAAATEFAPAGSVVWRTCPVVLPIRTDPGFSLADSLALMNNPKTPPVNRLYTGAVRAAFHHRSQRPIDFSSLAIGNARIVHLPGEPMIDFQLFAQGLKPGGFVAVAGYGDCGTGYICPAKAYRDGGYEPTDANAKPESELLVKKAIAELLDVDWAPDDRRQAIEGMEAVMGKLPDRANLPPPEVEVVGQIESDDFVRLDIKYLAEEGDRVPAHLYLPKKRPAGRRVPAIVALHQTTPLGKKEVAGEGGSPNLAYAKELAQRGYVVLAPDYPSFGDYPYDFGKSRYASGTMKGIFNHMRGVDLLQAREEVDPERIGAIGHSLGGHNAMFLGAFDQRIKVVVSSCGWTPFHDYYGGKLDGWAQDRYMPRIRDVYKLDPNLVPFDFHDVIAALAPRAFFSNSPLGDDNFAVAGVKKAEPKAREVFALFGAADRLQVRYPECNHDFPADVRREAYEFIDGILGHP